MKRDHKRGAFRDRAAFTLIELLAVIAILLILMSFLLPVAGGARRRALTVPCANNLRQIYTLCLGYAGDYDNELPQGLSENPQMFNINNPLFPQLRQFMAKSGYTPDIWYCPGVPREWADPAWWDDKPWTGRPIIPDSPEEFPIGYLYTGNVTRGSLIKFTVKPPFTFREFQDTGVPFVRDICKAYKPSPVEGADVTDWWIFPHHGTGEPAFGQFLMPGGHVKRQPVAEMSLNYTYYHPGLLYW
jgi:prepilin-type N-terminal cleavage/methylation domain-containing protein